MLVIGGCCHDYAKQKDILTKGISARANVQWTVSYDPDKGTKHLNPVYEKPDWAKDFDVVVHDECCSDVKDEAVIERILEPHRQGLPAVVLHCGMHCYRSKGYPKMTPWFEFTGLATNGHGAQLPIAVTFTDKESPITKGMENWTTIKEELYNNLTGQGSGHRSSAGAASRRARARTARNTRAKPSSCGPTFTRTRPASSPRRSATTTRPSPMPGISIW